VKTRAEPLGLTVKVGFVPDLMKEGDYFGVLAQYPSTTGLIHDMRPFAEQAHANGALFCVAADLLALTLLEAPGAWGADIVVGNSQRFGVPFGFGGPHAAFMGCKDAFKRSMPGRLVGVSVDSQGKPAYRLTLQTREQHIRREKATSNICTAQVLLAVMASMYAVYHGPAGLTRIAQRVHRLTAIFAEGLKRSGLKVNGTFFDTLAIAGVDAAKVLAAARDRGINLREFSRRDVGDHATQIVGVAFDETTTRADVETLWGVFGVKANVDDLDAAVAAGETAIPMALRRTTPFLTHRCSTRTTASTRCCVTCARWRQGPGDGSHDDPARFVHDEAQRDRRDDSGHLARVREHPPARARRPGRGYRQLIDELEQMLVECTGYDAVSLQPNSGAQGEYAGLLAIRAYHRARGKGTAPCA